MQHQKNFLSAESVLVNLRILSLLGKTVLLLKGADGFFVQNLNLQNELKSYSATVFMSSILKDKFKF